MNLHNRRNHLNIPRKNNRSSHGTGWDMCYGYTHLIRFPSTIWTLVMLSGFFIALLSGRKYFITSVIVPGFPRCFSVGAVWKELVL